MRPSRPNDLGAFWLPFTPNRDFKAAPRMLAGAEGMIFKSEDGRTLLDACSGLWCVNAGHGRKEIAEAIAKAAYELDFAPTFQFAHPQAFTLAERIAALAPEGLDHVFFVNSGSEACDAALKIARAFWQKKGEGGRFRLIGRDKGYHGVTFAGISVGGLANNRKPYGPLLPGTDDHLPLPYDAARMRFTRGEPETGADFADALDAVVARHGAETIAAVIVEPVSGSAGVFAPPLGYLKRLRAACDRHGILLIFDEVITGFGRLGAAFAAERYGVVPDMITFAKGVTNGAVPMGGVIVSRAIHDGFMAGPAHAIELFHGHTYSAHPLACAAGLATLDLYRDEELFGRAKALEPVFMDAVHSLRGESKIVDVRNAGLAAGIDIEPDPKSPGLRGYAAMKRCFTDQNLVIRVSGDTIALAPALIATESDIARMVDGVRAAVRGL
ncbi:MAG: aspartate aminotransferase family protein [Alphaproteobacteria bacterium]|nr:aspartate aminotransferase family protein [Alphaproteobacteria bacterium]MBV9694525.1 aspartate aminotransferase family protein [Alphaproteobacteria bacterium]